MSQQALVIVSRHGSFAVQTHPIPTPGTGEVLVKIHTTALNPIDSQLQRDDMGLVASYPAVFGGDAAGTVEQLGEGVERVAVGDRVIFQNHYRSNETGTFQQYALAPASILAKLPEAFSFDQGAVIPSSLITAAAGLYGAQKMNGAALVPFFVAGGRNKYQGKSILVSGGSTNVGQYVIQLARLSGFSLIVATSSKHNADILISLGATHVLDRNQKPEALVTETRKIVQDHSGKDTGVDFVFDTIAQPGTQQVALDVVATGGRILLTRPPRVPIPADSGVQMGMIYGSSIAQKDVSFPLLEKLPELLAAGDILPTTPTYLSGGLSGITEGLRMLKDGEVSATKLVVRPHEHA